MIHEIVPDIIIQHRLDKKIGAEYRRVPLDLAAALSRDPALYWT